VSDPARSQLVAAWDAAGFAPDPLAPVLDALDRGNRGQLRDRGEHLLADLVQPEIDGVYALARDRSVDLEDLERRRLDLAHVHASLRFVGAITDIPAREPKLLASTVRRRRG
jgi:hypothetical protein